ncbi:MAG TPA: hypothetical protein DDW55_08350 [Gammaproteobacteria bacterium]|nr:hypothetical protein [Gammaproteobacteria bacterium]
MPVAAFAQLTATLADPAPIYKTLLVSVNGIRNPDFLSSSVVPDPRFDRFVEIMTELSRAYRLRWIEDSPNSGQFSVVIEDYGSTRTNYGAERLSNN